MGSLTLSLTVLAFVSSSYAQSDLNATELSSVVSVCGGVALIILLVWMYICYHYCNGNWNFWKFKRSLQRHAERNRQYLERRQQQEQHFGRRQRAAERQPPPDPIPSAPPPLTPQVDRRFHSTFLSELAQSPSAEFRRSLRIQRNKISSQAHKISVVGSAGQPSSVFLSPNDPRLSPVDFKISPSDQNILPQQSLQTTATKGVRHQSPQQLATPNSNPPSSLQHQVPSITVKLAENISQPNFNSHNASRKPHKTEDNQLALQPSPSALQYSKNHFNIPGTISQQSIPMEQIQSEHARSVGSSGNGISHREKPRGAINGIARESNEKPLYHQQHQPALHRVPLIPRAAVGPYMPKSLREEEEVDVEVDPNHLPPRYCWLFSQKIDGRRPNLESLGANVDPQDMAMFGQISSWPKFS